MNKRFLWLLPVLALVASCGPKESAAVGGVAPNFTVETLKKRGEFEALETNKGKVVLIDFWATWCGPCHQIMPALENLHRTYGKDGLKIMAISNEARGDVAKFKVTSPTTYSVYLDTDNSVNELYNVQGYPTLVLIDRQGKVLFNGPPESYKQIQTMVEDAMKS